LYIADSGNHRIRRVDSSGIITTVAGMGEPGFNGDGGLATAAHLAAPASVAFDTAGNLLISDSNNHRIRRVDRVTGIITTIAGNGMPGFSGDGGPATDAQLKNPWGLAVEPNGDLIVADISNGRLRRVGVNGVITTIVAEVTFRGPLDVVFDSISNIYVADLGSERILSVDPSGAVKVVVDSAVLNEPRGVAVDRLGNIFISDRCRVLKVSAER
jgi:sugar lactone lactonase YvrE